MRRAARTLPPAPSVLPTGPLPVALFTPLAVVLALIVTLLAAPFARAVTAPAAAPAATAQQRTPVVLVHGYGDTAASLDGLEDYLHAHGWLSADLAEFGYDWAATNTSNAGRFGAFLTERFGDRPVDIVAHSMGSLLTRRFLKDGGSARVRSWVSLGGPNHGAGDASPCGPFGTFCDVHAASLAEMAPGSDLLDSLNAGDETPGATRYTTFSSACDQQIPPGDSRAPRSTELAGAVNHVLPEGDSGCPSHFGLLGNDWVRRRIVEEFSIDPVRTVELRTGPFRITVDEARFTSSGESGPELYDGLTLTTDGAGRSLWHRDRSGATAFPAHDPWFGLDDTARSQVFTDGATVTAYLTDADRTAGNNDDVMAAGRIHWDPSLGFGRRTARFLGVDGGEATVTYTVTPVAGVPQCRVRVDAAELTYFDDGTTRPALYGSLTVRAADGARGTPWSRSGSDPSTFPNKGARTDPDPYFYQQVGTGAAYGGPAPLEIGVYLWDHDASSADDLVARGTVAWDPYTDRPGTRTNDFYGDDDGHVKVTWTVTCP
ncbi:esterase/lipase family protein [Streptomyces sp. NPDC051555]|uniref:esterase/lipase family protein n=1 Tax=Streptomyces sp. NPDC051555 TaxID=3365657 RepID=UPI0037A7489D